MNAVLQSPMSDPAASPAHFDLVVLGSGSAGSKVAKTAAKEGLSVLVIENRDFGGTCALRGCNPKKVLVRAAELVDLNAKMRGRYLPDDATATLDWQATRAFQDTFTEPIPPSQRSGLIDAGCRVAVGDGRLTGPHSLTLEANEHTGDDRGPDEVRFDKLVIAVGGRPAPVPFEGGELALTSDDFLKLDRLPKRIVFLGGGYISSEFAHVCLVAGCETAIVERGRRILDIFDPDMTDRLEAHSRSRGMRIYTGSEVKCLSRDGDGFRVALQTEHFSGETDSHTLDCDLVVHGLGRVPAIDSLDLEAAGIDREKTGVTVDEQLKSTSQPHVWALGDCAAHGKPMLTPTANETARCVAAQFRGQADARPDFGPIPFAAYTQPPLASVGMMESEARERYGDDLEVRHKDMHEWTTFRKLGTEVGAFKSLVQKSTDRIVGAHLIGPEAPELINFFAVAMKGNLTASDLKSVLFTYPTLAHEIRAMV